MSVIETVYQQIHDDAWRWIKEFVTQPNEFYHHKFAPCPYAKKAVMNGTVDVVVWEAAEDVLQFIVNQSLDLHHNPQLTTRLMVFPPKVQHHWGLSEFIENLNIEMIPQNVFLNTGVMQHTASLFPGTGGKPYFMVVANSLLPVLEGAEALAKTDYYEDWPKEHYELVVVRRARMAKKFGANLFNQDGA